MIQVCFFLLRGALDKKLRSGGTGCGIVSPSDSSFGEPFNAAGGGVFGMLWDGTGIRMCKSLPSSCRPVPILPRSSSPYSGVSMMEGQREEVLIDESELMNRELEQGSNPE
jgi:hypothetical protein